MPSSAKAATLSKVSHAAPLNLLFAEAQIDTWVDYIQSTVAPAAFRVLDQVSGKIMSDQRTFSVSLNELKQSL